jgi:hypothetical protein
MESGTSKILDKLRPELKDYLKEDIMPPLKDSLRETGMALGAGTVAGLGGAALGNLFMPRAEKPESDSQEDLDEYYNRRARRNQILTLIGTLASIGGSQGYVHRDKIMSKLRGIMPKKAGATMLDEKYAEGFVELCAKHNVDPERIIKAAQSLPAAGEMYGYNTEDQAEQPEQANVPTQAKAAPVTTSAGGSTPGAGQPAPQQPVAPAVPGFSSPAPVGLNKLPALPGLGKKSESGKREKYAEILSAEERAGAMKLGAVTRLASQGLLDKSAASLLNPDFLMKFVIGTSLITGVSAGTAAHILDKRISDNKRRERELIDKSRYFRNATKDLSQNLGGGTAQLPGA